MSSARIRLLFLALLLTGCAAEAETPAAQTIAASAPAQAQEEPSLLADRLAAGLLRTAKLPGLSLAVSRDGEIRYTGVFGHADLESQRPVTPQTRFRAASVSKIITVTALARLVQRDSIDLDVSIDRYVPDLPAPLRPITPRQLAGHLGGIPHYTGADRIERRFYPSVRDALGVFSHVTPLGPPGQQYHYSTHGYTLLSAAIEGAAGVPFVEYLQRAVLEPLEMRATGPDLRAAPAPTNATLYLMREGVPERAERPEDPSYKWAGGGMLSTPSDLVRLAAAYQHGFLAPDVVETLFTSQRLPSGEETGVGVGWRRSRDMEGRRVIEHAGGMEGARSVVALFPAERVAIAIMTNATWSSSIEETAHLIALPFLSPPRPIPQPRGAAEITVTLRDDDAEPRTLPGRLHLGADTAWIAYPSADGATQSFPLVYLNRGDVYALVRPDGLFHLTLQADGGRVRGRAVRYWSQLEVSPAEGPPFLTFEGVLTP